MTEITSARWLYIKAVLFLLIGLFSGGLLLLDSPSLRTLALLLCCIWGFSRAYYFVFYVIEHYIDPGHKFSGLGAFVHYAWTQWTAKRR